MFKVKEEVKLKERTRWNSTLRVAEEVCIYWCWQTEKGKQRRGDCVHRVLGEKKAEEMVPGV